MDPAKSKFTPSEFRHPPFEGELREAIAEIQHSFPGVYDHSFEFWEDGFRRDRNPQNEIFLWLIIAGIFGQFADGKPLSYRKEVFRLLATCSTTSQDTIEEVFGSEVLSREDAKSISSSYFAALKK